MSKRQYDQQCALAAGLDVLGDRWTLLITRELIFGVRRYSDLLRGLPGIGTNLLARRLKELLQTGLIEQQKLPPPAATTVYALTAEGRTAVLPIIRAFTNFGVHRLQTPPAATTFVPASSTMGAMSKFFVSGETAVSEMVQFNVEEDIFICQIEAGQLLGLGFGLPPQPPTIILAAAAEHIMGAVMGYLDPAPAIEQGEIKIEKGSKTAVLQFFNQFQKPTTTQPHLD